MVPLCETANYCIPEMCWAFAWRSSNAGAFLDARRPANDCRGTALCDVAEILTAVLRPCQELLFRCLPDLQRAGFHFGAAVAQDFVGVPDGFAVQIICILWQKVDNMP